MTDVVRLREQLVQRLLDRDYLAEQWTEAVATVPRQLFVPDVIWLPTAQNYLPMCRGDDPQSWLELVHGEDERIVAQVDDGAPGGQGQHATCTVLAVSEVTWLLSLITATPGMRVCVVGAGLGYTTALLAHRLGASAVSAVEIDPDLAAECRHRLGLAGFGDVTVLTADATTALPGTAPFDLLLSTMTVQRIPGRWLHRVRPGGTIITGYGNAFCPDPVVQLQVQQPGLAAGHVVGEIECEWARAERSWPALTAADIDATAAGADHTTANPGCVSLTYDSTFAIGTRLAGCARLRLSCDDQWLLDPATGSRARRHQLPFGRHRVDQYGPRRLWDELHAAYCWWAAIGRPQAGDWLITATPGITTATAPANVITGKGRRRAGQHSVGGAGEFDGVDADLAFQFLDAPVVGGDGGLVG